VSDEVCIPIENESDIVLARQRGRDLAGSLGFSNTDKTLIATAISEIARNIVTYAGRGELALIALDQQHPPGLLVIATDQGPGIKDPELAMRDGYSTGKSLGMGLPGAKRLMDEFELISSPGQGTTVRMTKWRR
jgi:serine/threonine-protein kinase RsbT